MHQRPLETITVIDWATLIAGPIAATFMADSPAGRTSSTRHKRGRDTVKTLTRVWHL